MLPALLIVFSSGCMRHQLELALHPISIRGENSKVNGKRVSSHTKPPYIRSDLFIRYFSHAERRTFIPLRVSAPACFQVFWKRVTVPKPLWSGACRGALDVVMTGAWPPGALQAMPEEMDDFPFIVMGNKARRAHTRSSRARLIATPASVRVRTVSTGPFTVATRQATAHAAPSTGRVAGAVTSGPVSGSVRVASTNLRRSAPDVDGWMRRCPARWR